MGLIASLKNDLVIGTPSVKEIARARLREIYIKIGVTAATVVALGVLTFLVYRHLI